MSLATVAVVLTPVDAHEGVFRLRTELSFLVQAPDRVGVTTTDGGHRGRDRSMTCHGPAVRTVVRSLFTAFERVVVGPRWAPAEVGNPVCAIRGPLPRSRPGVARAVHVGKPDGESIGVQG